MHHCESCLNTFEGTVCPHCGYPEIRATQPHQLPVGTVLAERYRLGRVLGQGGYGITYLGWDLQSKMKVAVKEFYPSAVVNRDTATDTHVRCNTLDMEPHYQSSLRRFLREAKALTQYRDIPEIVDIYDFLEENGTAYIIMEYVQGMDLASYVRKKGGKLTAEETLRILRPVMEALAEVHAGGCIHRDISPDNIILHPTGGAKLLDFGAVRAVVDPQIGKELSHSTEAILKHGFAPIEQYHSRGAIGPWTDEYAMCATIWYCLTGRIPDNAPIRVTEGTDPDWSQVPGLTRSQRLALQRGLSVRAKDRFEDMEELIDELFQPELASKLPARSALDHRQLSHDPARRNRRPLWPVFLAVVLVAVAALALILFPDRSEPAPEETEETEQQVYTEPIAPYLEEADALAMGYDYDGAIAVLDSYPGEQPSVILERRAHYLALKASLLEWKDYSAIPNLSFHVLIADPARAFSDEDLRGQYNRNFVTTEEFSRILEQLYSNGYVLVDFDSFTQQEDGTILTVPILLPEGKKPLMLTQTLCNYFDYMVDGDGDGEPDDEGSGFAYRMIVDEKGDVKNLMIDTNGDVQIGNYDLVPILEDFINLHPDFSYRGARATLALTGYEGVFGYREAKNTFDSLLQIRNAPSMGATVIGRLTPGAEIDILRVEIVNNEHWWLINDGWVYGEELSKYIGEDNRIREENKSADEGNDIAGLYDLIPELKRRGYVFACNTYGNVAYGDRSATQIQADLQEWTNQITPVIGNVDVLVYARTSDIADYSGAKFQVLNDFGFRYFICHGSQPYSEINNTYVKQSRLMVTGENMSHNAEMFAGLFDPQSVLLPERTQVPQG